MNAKAIWPLLKETYNEWSEDKAPRLGAALAYYTVFSIAPILVIAMAVAGWVFGNQASQSYVQQEVAATFGSDSGKAIQTMVEHANKGNTSVIATILGVIVLLFGASGVFGQLQDALNTVWKVEPKPGRGIWGIIKDRFLSFTMVLGICFLLLVSLAVSAVLAALGTYTQALPGGAVLWEGVNSLVSFLVITLLFAMMYRFLPDAKIAWGDVWLGAAVTAVLFTLGKFLIGLYLGTSGVASAYGAVGSLVVLLLWVYYSSQIFLFGAEFTRVYANRFGSRVVPAENAVSVTEEQRARQGMASTERVKEAAARADGRPAQTSGSGTR
jgi:membrane protein